MMDHDLPSGFVHCDPPVDIPGWDVTWHHNKEAGTYGLLAISEPTIDGRQFGQELIVAEAMLDDPEAVRTLRGTLEAKMQQWIAAKDQP